MIENKITCSNILDLCGYDAGCELCCMLEAGHDGPHRDEFEHDGQSVVIMWWEEAKDDKG